ncbi:MAG: PLP-dependent aminotransferase family protein [Desulfobacterales bacterium]|nr:PLP-dependent aminotransferase family protein [Desulfobacterales bacterium]MCP4160728.1 PLP-dependent aminotransferase family protein [Deltaproteobacteria bacterium]
MKTESLLAARTLNMGENAIREILKVVSREGMISLAGGIPSPESFPVNIIKKLSQLILDKYGDQALQYGLTEGFYPLRETLAKQLRKTDIIVSADDIIISSGSQGALDSLGKTLITKGDKIAVEAPTYLGAISAFNPYEPEYITIETDDQGIIPESLENILKKGDVKFIYLVPTFQNPTGRTLSLNRRVAVADLIKRYNTLLIEDDPYSALRYSGENLPQIKSIAPSNTIYIGTLSKILSPGLRVGYIVAPKAIKEWSVLVKQGVDLHTSSFSQAIGYEYLEGGYFDKHLPYILDLYKPKKDTMLKALKNNFPDSFTWSKPEGGMFIWVEGPKGFNAESLYHKAIQENVAFVPGKYFYTNNEGSSTMRLNFTMSSPMEIETAIKRIASLL